MTTERDNEEMDKLVADTYRQLDEEQAPEHLNEAILRMASKAGALKGPVNFLNAAWMKPVAWAAMTGVTLAIVLELSQLPSTPTPMAIPPTAESVSDEFKLQDADMLDKAEEQALRQNGPSEQPLAEDESIAAAKLESRENRSKSVVSAPEPGLEEAIALEEEIALEEAIVVDAEVEKPSIRREFEQTTETENVASIAESDDSPARRKRARDDGGESHAIVVQSASADAVAAGSIEAAVNAESPAAARAVGVARKDSFAMSVELSDSTPACDLVVRQSAEDWRDCIVSLRESGASEEAAREYEAFVLEYPAEPVDVKP
jgi:hypothetical protein